MSEDAWMGLAITFGSGALLWGMRVHWMIKRTLAMHQEPDRFGFGTTETNRLLRDYMAQENEMHRANTQALRDLNRVISELTYYIRWSTKQTTGNTPPPFVSDEAAARGT